MNRALSSGGHNHRMDAAQDNTALIAGGGIAGMAAALALARTGWQARVWEQAPAFAEVGAGVQLGPNVTRILREWQQLPALLRHACQPRALAARSVHTGEVLGRLDLHDLSARHGAPYVSIHRADLHALLHDAACAAGVSVRTGVCVERLQTTADAAVLEASGHDAVRADLAVVADGVWSRLRQQLLGDGGPRWSGHMAYRALMPMADLPVACRWTEVQVWMGPDVHVVAYPVSAGERLNVVCLVETDWPEGLPREDWDGHQDAARTRADLQRALRGAASGLQALIDACEGWRLWPLYGRAPVRGAHEQAQGRIALLGDAAHPMLPYLAQGAGMAIEDAQALAQSLQAVRAGTVGVPEAVRAFAQARWARNARVQQRAQRNGEIFHAKGVMRMGRDAGLRLLGARLMDVPWLYGHRL